jgi:hypothetical protein
MRELAPIRQLVDQAAQLGRLAPDRSEIAPDRRAITFLQNRRVEQGAGNHVHAGLKGQGIGDLDPHDLIEQRGAQALLSQEGDDRDIGVACDIDLLRDPSRRHGVSGQHDDQMARRPDLVGEPLRQAITDLHLRLVDPDADPAMAEAAADPTRQRLVLPAVAYERALATRRWFRRLLMNVRAPAHQPPFRARGSAAYAFSKRSRFSAV